MMTTLDIRAWLVHAINRYGYIPFLIAYFFVTIGVAAGVYFIAIKPLYNEISLYTATMSRVQDLEKKFGPLLQSVPVELSVPVTTQGDGQSLADGARIIDRALDYGLIIESSVCQKHHNHEQHVIKLRGTFDMIMGFLEQSSTLGVVLHAALIKATHQGIIAQLTFGNNANIEERQ